MSYSSQRILIVDDEPRMCRSLQILLAEEVGCEVDIAFSYYEALEKLTAETSVLVIDLTMPGKDGIELLKEVKKIQPKADVIMMTAYSTVESAIQAIREGAMDYLIKPFKSEKLLELVDKALRRQRQRTIRPISQTNTRDRYGDIIGASKPMQLVYELIERASEIDSTVLVTGESGTGKEMVARAIHFNGLRKRYPFVCINCSSLSEDSFVDANATNQLDKATSLVGAKQGTVFLDEISDLPNNLQIKLRRLLENKQLDGEKDSNQDFDIRCIAATCVDVNSNTGQNRLREDLFYQLNVFSINLPPLRSRKEDIPLLTEYFLKTKAQHFKIKHKTLSKGSYDLLMKYDFPGNVRELENIIERALIVSKHRTIHKEDLAVPQKVGGTMLPLDDNALPIEDGWNKIQHVSRQLERKLIAKALETYRGLSNSEIAALLGTSRRILELRLKEYDIEKS